MRAARPAHGPAATARRYLPNSLVPALRFIWIIAVVWYELIAFYWSTFSCRWPDSALLHITHNGHSQSLPPPTHVLLVADPQVIDGRSYPGRPWPLTILGQFIVDLNIRKNWRVARSFHPDVVVFLGDMMDGGRFNMDDAEYEDYYTRFKTIFQLEPGTDVYYIPGNHDVGLGKSRAFSPSARRRYIEHFGPLNYRISLANHTLVMLDAPGLVEEDYRRAPTGLSFDEWPAPLGGATDFIGGISAVGSDDPVVLFTHIPLFRPDTAPCGPLRERGTIRRGVGFGYQNTLGRYTTNYILNHIQPNLVFSGDDHDYCEYTHSVPLLGSAPDSASPEIARIREVTVKSLSMAMGVHRPGFQLLSLSPEIPTSDSHDDDYLDSGIASNTIPRPRHADAPCVLPDQIGIWLSRYAPLFFFTLLALFWRAVRVRRRFGLQFYNNTSGYNKSRLRYGYRQESDTKLGLGLSSCFGSDSGAGGADTEEEEGLTTMEFGSKKKRRSGIALQPSFTRIKLSPRVAYSGSGFSGRTMSAPHSRSHSNVNANANNNSMSPSLNVNASTSSDPSGAAPSYASRANAGFGLMGGMGEVGVGLGMTPPVSASASTSPMAALDAVSSRRRGISDDAYRDREYGYGYPGPDGIVDDDEYEYEGGGGGGDEEKIGDDGAEAYKEYGYIDDSFITRRRLRRTHNRLLRLFPSALTSLTRFLPSFFQRGRSTPLSLTGPSTLPRSSTTTNRTLLSIFFSSLAEAAWPPLLVFLLVNVYAWRY